MSGFRNMIHRWLKLPEFSASVTDTVLLLTQKINVLEARLNSVQARVKREGNSYYDDK